MSKVWYKSKTMIFNLLMVITGVAGVVYNHLIDNNMMQFLPDYVPAVMTVLSMINVALRSITSSAVTLKESDTDA